MRDLVSTRHCGEGGQAPGGEVEVGVDCRGRGPGGGADHLVDVVEAGVHGGEDVTHDGGGATLAAV